MSKNTFRYYVLLALPLIVKVGEVVIERGWWGVGR